MAQQQISFTKMHGLGNDYIYINCFSIAIRNPQRLSRIVSNRHTGIGSDGLILILPSKKADVRMRMFNADGSEAEMCGNGIRCLAKYVYEHRIIRKKIITCETQAGIKKLTLFLSRNNRTVRRVSVAMGKPLFDCTRIPIKTRMREFIKQNITVARHTFTATCLSLGNPHCVIFTKNVDRIPLEQWGPLLESHALFPNRINVEFVQIIDDKNIALRIWERGSGITLASGTGSTASAAAFMKTHTHQKSITVHLPLGTLRITQQPDGELIMTGPASEVFSGTVVLPLL